MIIQSFSSQKPIMATSHFSLFVLSIFVTFFHAIASSSKLSLQFHHHFSDTVRQWQESQGFPATWRKEDVPHGTAEYYKILINHDLHRHRGRFLAQGDLYSFANEGNMTMQYLNLLHYAFVALGTPSQKFLVMLDTGSHLFWVPCNCRQCAPNTSPSYGKFKFNNYMPNASSTSKPVTCSSSQCDKRYRNVCLNSTGDCTYLAQYAMADTASSGILMQDVLSFMNERNTQDIIQLPIVFGCGKVQTGAFLRDAPNGLMGLGLDSFAVPTMLAKKGIISDSFSMCFGDDGNGRLKFGDKGNPGQNETPLVVQNGFPYYNINITEMVVGNKTIKAEFTTLVDSGTNFALLEDPLYTQFTAAFSAQVEDRRIIDPDIPLDYCYESNSKKNNAHPSVRFTTKGGSQFPMLAPIVGLYDEFNMSIIGMERAHDLSWYRMNSNPVGYCLAVVQSTDGNVIGAIAMTGLNVVHDREKLVLGWQEADCYGSLKNGTKKPESPNSPPRPLDSWAPHASASNVLNILICLFMMSLPVVLFD